MSQVLAARGIDVARALPWVQPWFLRYQMADGGLTCDNDAYNTTSECPSSMVGTLAPFEAMLRGDPKVWSTDHAAFVAGAAAFLVGRKARLGSPSTLNAAERTREPAWRELCFPRFYFYDVLRGLHALARWSSCVTAGSPRGDRACYDVPVRQVPRRRRASGATVVRRRGHPCPRCERRVDSTRRLAVSAARRDERGRRGVPVAHAKLDRNARRAAALDRSRPHPRLTLALQPSTAHPKFVRGSVMCATRQFAERIAGRRAERGVRGGAPGKPRTECRDAEHRFVRTPHELRALGTSAWPLRFGARPAKAIEDAAIGPDAPVRPARMTLSPRFVRAEGPLSADRLDRERHQGHPRRQCGAYG